MCYDLANEHIRSSLMMARGEFGVERILGLLLVVICVWSRFGPLLSP